MYLTNWGKIWAIKSYSTVRVGKCLSEVPKPIRIFGDPDNQRPDKPNSTVITIKFKVIRSLRCDGINPHAPTNAPILRKITSRPYK